MAKTAERNQERSNLRGRDEEPENIVINLNNKELFERRSNPKPEQTAN
jgi:hypothetical protein